MARVAQGIVRVVPLGVKLAVVALAALALGLGISTLLTRRRLTAAERLAATDMLTGLANHRSVQETLRRMVAQAQRTATPLAAIIFDLDHFKCINDEHGHAIGDEVLSGVGAAFRRTFRASDFAGRYGGEEFVMLLSDTDRDGAVVAAEKLRRSLKAMRVYGIEREITASFGVAVIPDDASEAADLLHRADQALYAAKERGRDRVEVAGAEVRELVPA